MLSINSPLFTFIEVFFYKDFLRLKSFIKSNILDYLYFTILKDRLLEYLVVYNGKINNNINVDNKFARKVKENYTLIYLLNEVILYIF